MEKISLIVGNVNKLPNGLQMNAVINRNAGENV